jgi:chorismate-pyruvate lyase
VNTPGSTALERLLLDSSDTVTHLLESLTGEPLVADVLRQSSQPTGAGADFDVLDVLDISVGEPVLQRIALLRGHVSGIPYAYAESAYPPGRLPEPVRRQLAQTTDPIGRVLVAHGLSRRREEVPPASGAAPPPLDAVAGTFGVVAWWRSYRLVVDDVPVFAIREWFFQSVLEAMTHQGPG